MKIHKEKMDELLKMSASRSTLAMLEKIKEMDKEI